MNKILGIIYPFSQSMLNHIVKGKDIFIKNQPHESKPKLINEGMRLFFYITGGKKKIVGECTIEKIELLEPPKILLKYNQRLLITKREFEDYLSNKQHKKILVIEFSNYKFYNTPKEPIKPVTMTGRYVYSNEFS